MARNKKKLYNPYQEDTEMDFNPTKSNKLQDTIESIKERAPFFTAYTNMSYLSQSEMNYNPRTTITSFNNTTKPSYMKASTLKDASDRILYDYLYPFMNRQNTGDNLISKTIAIDRRWADMPSQPDRRSIHDVSYYKNLYTKLTTTGSITAYDTETMGENIWQIGYAYGVQGMNAPLTSPDGLSSGNSILLPSDMDMEKLKKIAETDYSLLTPDEQVVYKTLSNIGSDNTNFIRTVSDDGMAHYQMASYADADISKKNAIAGYQKLSGLKEQSAGDKLFDFNGIQLRSDQKDFLDIVGGKIFSADVVCGHNIEQFDNPKLIRNISMIPGGWDYLEQNYNLSRKSFDTKPMLDMNDMIRSLSLQDRMAMEFSIYGTNASELAEPGKTPWQLSTLKDKLELQNVYPEYKNGAGVSHSADFDAKMSYALLQNDTFKNAVLSIIDKAEIPETMEPQRLQINDWIHFDKGSFGYIKPDQMRMLSESPDKTSVLFDTGYGRYSQEMEQNGFGKDFDMLVGAAIPKDTDWKVSGMEQLDITKLDKVHLKQFKEIAPQLVDNQLFHLTLENPDNQKIHLFGTESVVMNNLSHMGSVIQNPEESIDKIEDRYWDRRYDRARRTLEQASSFTEDRLNDLWDISIDTFNELEDRYNNLNYRTLTDALMQRASAIAYGVSSGNQLSLEYQRKLGLDMIVDGKSTLNDTIEKNAREISKWLDFGMKKLPGGDKAVRQVGSLAYAMNLSTIIGNIGDEYNHAYKRMVAPVTEEFDKILDEREAAGEFGSGNIHTDNPQFIKATKKRIRKEISGMVHQQIAEEIARRYPALALAPDLNKYKLDTAGQESISTLNKGIILDLTKDTADYDFINKVLNFYNTDPTLEKNSISRQSDILIRFITESRDPALAKLKDAITRKSDKGLSNEEKVRYDLVKSILNSENINPRQIASLTVEDIKAYRKAHPDSGFVARNKVDLKFAVEHPEILLEVSKDSRFRQQLFENAVDAASNTLGTQRAYGKALSTITSGSEFDIVETADKLYGKDSSQANQLLTMQRTIEEELNEVYSQFAKASSGTRLKYDRTTGQFFLYNSSGSKVEDVTKYMPRVGMYGDTLSVRFGNVHYALGMGYDFEGPIESGNFKFRSNLKRAFDKTYSISARKVDTDDFSATLGYIRDVARNFREQGAIGLYEGSLQDAKFNFSLDFSHSYVGLLNLSQDESFLRTLSNEDASEFQNQFYNRYRNASHPENIIAKLQEGRLDAEQRNIFNKILPNLNEQMANESLTGETPLTESASILWNGYMQNLYFDYKNHMVSNGIVLTNELAVGGEGYTNLARDIQNQVTRATVFQKQTAERIFEKLGIHDVTVGNALMTKAGDSWFNSRDINGTEYAATIQAPVYQGNQKTLQKQVNRLKRNLVFGANGKLYDKRTGQAVEELSGYTKNQISKAAKELTTNATLREGGSLLDARILDATGITNDFNPIKLKEDLQLSGFDDIQNIHKIQDANKLIPILEKDEKGNLHMRYATGKYIKEGTAIFRRTGGYAESEETIYQKESGIVRGGFFNSANKLVDADEITRAVYQVADQQGITIKTSEDFYNILHHTLKDTYYGGFYTEKIAGQGAVKLVHDMSEKAETRQLYGYIGDVFPEVKETLKKIGLEGIPKDLSYGIFKDLIKPGFVYNDYLVSKINEYILNYNDKNYTHKRKDNRSRVGFIDEKTGKLRTYIRNQEDYEAWIRQRIGTKGFQELGQKLEAERYLKSRILHAATGGYGINADPFIHHHGAWQPVNQLISDMILHERNLGKTTAEANAIVFNALQPEKAKNAVFLMPDKNGDYTVKALRIDKETGRILLPEKADFSISTKQLERAAKDIYGTKEGKEKFLQILGGFEDPDNQEAISIDKNGKRTALCSTREGYLTTSSISVVHDNFRNGHLGGMNTSDVLDKINKAGNVSDRELAKASLIRRSTESIQKAQKSWLAMGGSEESFRKIYGIGLHDDAYLAQNLNQSIENPYIQEIRSNQFFSPEELIKANGKKGPVSVAELTEEQISGLSRQEQDIIESLRQKGFEDEKISLRSVRELSHGASGMQAVLANKVEGVSAKDANNLVTHYGFTRMDIAKMKDIRTKALVESSIPNIFNKNMILNLTDTKLGITEELLKSYGGISTLATAAISPSAFGSQEIQDDLRRTFSGIENVRYRIMEIQKKYGDQPEDKEAKAKLQHLYQQYAIKTVQLKDAQQRIFSGRVSPLKQFSHVGMAYSIRPKVNVTNTTMDIHGDWAKKAKIHGMSVLEYSQKTGLTPDIVRISPEDARKMGLITEDLTTSLGRKQLQDLMTNGIMVHTNRSPSNYAGSDVATRLYVGTDVQNGQAQLSHYLAVKMKADTDGDAARQTADQFVYKHNVLNESNIRILNSVKDNEKRFLATAKSYGFRNLSVADMDIINTKWENFANVHIESELYQQNIVNPALAKAQDTVAEVDKLMQSGRYNNVDMMKFRNEFAKQVMPEQFAASNPELLVGRPRTAMLSSKEAETAKQDYSLLESEFKTRNNIEASRELTDEETEKLRKWAGVDAKRAGIFNRYKQVLTNERAMLTKTRQMFAGIVDLPVYRMARMTQMAQNLLPGREATELQNLFTVMQEGFLSPKNSIGGAPDPKAVSNLIDITTRMSRAKNGSIDQSAFNDMADWIRHNAAKAPGVRMITVNGKSTLDKEYYAKLASETLPNLFRKMPNFFAEMNALDQVFLSDKGIDTERMATALEASMHDDIAKNSLTGSVLNAIVQPLTEEDKQKHHLRDTSDIVAPHTERNRGPKVRPYQLDEAVAKANRQRYESFLQRASKAVEKTGGSKKVIAGIIGGLGFAGYMGGNPSEDPQAEQKIQQQKRPVNAQPMPNFSDTSVLAQRGLSSASGGYIINVNAQTKQGKDFAQQVINQATSNTFNQMDINISTHMKDDTPTASPDMIADYIQSAMTN
jgi:hypothetical protein